MSVLVEEGFFDQKIDYPTIQVVILTMAWSKVHDEGKGKEQVEEGSSPTKVIWKQTHAQTKKN